MYVWKKLVVSRRIRTSIYVILMQLPCGFFRLLIIKSLTCLAFEPLFEVAF